MRTVPFAVVLVCLSIAPVLGGEPPDAAAEDALQQAVLACPLSLRKAMESAYGADRRPVSAEFVLSDDGGLLLRATVRIQEGENASFERWLGPVHGAGWVPLRRTLEGGPALTEAERQWARMAEDPDLLRKALEGAVRTDERPAPADLALAVTTVEQDGVAQASLRVGVDGLVRGLQFDPGASTYAVVAPTPSPKRVTYDAPALPAFHVVDGTWFNVDAPPTLEAWRGNPVLVVITDPG